MTTLPLKNSIAARERAGELVEQHRSFSNNERTLHGRAGGASDIGMLDPTWRDLVSRARYVIYSYSTPIAWEMSGLWIMPSENYSTATTQHKAIVKTWILAGKDMVEP